ncbi:hypothetical protein SEA_SCOOBYDOOBYDOO_137 [Mycobacterium phage ScoobyDoobyDoo]|nr:hypothetical protein SEA_SCOOBYDOOBYDOO_137 [Mycobacterium phage ScoobyDoobyDoo]
MSNAAITLFAQSPARTFPVRFYGEAAEDNALAFVARRSDLTFFEDDSDPANRIGDEFTRLLSAIYPLCEHGMSADLCEGPQHYPYDDEERAYYGY